MISDCGCGLCRSRDSSIKCQNKNEKEIKTIFLDILSHITLRIRHVAAVAPVVVAAAAAAADGCLWQVKDAAETIK